MRRIIVALQVSLDGFIEGPDGELDWVNSWEDGFGLMDQVDGFVLGGGMYRGYEAYWSAILANPTGVLEFTGRPPLEGEIAYAARASRTPHLVLSTTLRSAQWPVTRIVRDIAGVREFKAAPGMDIHAIREWTFTRSAVRRLCRACSTRAWWMSFACSCTQSFSGLASRCSETYAPDTGSPCAAPNRCRAALSV